MGFLFCILFARVLPPSLFVSGPFFVDFDRFLCLGRFVHDCSSQVVFVHIMCSVRPFANYVAFRDGLHVRGWGLLYIVIISLRRMEFSRSRVYV